MVDLKQLQEKIYKNKIDKNFNVTDIYMEFCYLHIEVAEAIDAYYRQNGEIGEELADVAIYLLGLAEILGINLEDEILRKMEINEKRQYDIKGRIDNETGS